MNVPPYTTTETASAQIYTAFILALKFSLTGIKLHLNEIMVKSGNNYYHFTQWLIFSTVRTGLGSQTYEAIYFGNDHMYTCFKNQECLRYLL